MVSVLPVNDSGAARMAEESEPPAPIRSPPSVVLPVPPKLTAREVVPLTIPVPLVNRSALLVPERVRLEVDAREKNPVVALRAVVDAKERLREPVMYALPFTESAEPGDVVPMPKNPLEVMRAASVRRPALRVENARSPFATFVALLLAVVWVRIDVMALVVVALLLVVDASVEKR